MRSLAALLLVAAGLAVPTAPAEAAPTVTYPGLPPIASGIDVSFPQCDKNSHVDYPPGLPFAIIGLNGGIASNDNKCLRSEFNSALLLGGQTDQPHAAVYVNTGNPALAAAWWPSDDTTQDGSAVANPDGSCEHKPGAACAYVYGYSMAKADYRKARQKLSRVPDVWWLDVETSNTWQSDTNANAASLTGMVDYFQSKSLHIGIYSTALQWKKIAGVTPSSSHLAGLPSWIAGGTYVGAPKDCEQTPLTPGGRVAMIQFVTHFDNDYSCQRFPGAGALIQTPGAPVAGSTLQAVPGDWGASGTTFTYQWQRNDVDIKGATSASYVAIKDDVDANLSVTITGTALGHSTTAKTSATLAILGTLVPGQVSITGTPSSGNTLSVSSSGWKPGQVSFVYAWYRDGTLVESGANANTYSLTSKDVGSLITATVTGSETGYATATASAITSPITQ